MWWLWVYWPRRMVARLGQQRELVTNALSKVVPFSINARRLGMCFNVSTFTSSRARSSVRIRITFGSFGSSLISLLVSSTQEKQPASSKRKGMVLAPAIQARRAGLSVLFALVEGLPYCAHLPPAGGDSGTSTVTVYPARDSQDVPYGAFCTCSWGVEDATFLPRARVSSVEMGLMHTSAHDTA